MSSSMISWRERALQVHKRDEKECSQGRVGGDECQG